MLGKPARKRNRKRKRRVAFSDSSSSDEDTSSSSSSSSPEASTPKTIPVSQSIPSANAVTDDEEDSEPSSSSDESQDDSGPDEQDASVPLASTKPVYSEPQRDSPSPQPDVDMPPFLPPNAPESERVLKEKFRKFWMASIADGFKDDLEEIRREPNLSPSRLALLIESLASGAEVFSSSSVNSGVNEMEVVLDQLP